MDQQELIGICELAAALIDREQAKCNDGRGVTCARSIIAYLNQGLLNHAKAVWFNDGDKLRQYPELERVVESALGCRLHGKQKCLICKHDLNFWPIT